jgi:hypothetical protein
MLVDDALSPYCIMYLCGWLWSEAMRVPWLKHSNLLSWSYKGGKDRTYKPCLNNLYGNGMSHQDQDRKLKSRVKEDSNAQGV